MNSRTLTLQTLIDKRACVEQIDLFRAKFGESVEVTEALCRSVASEFDWHWAGNNLLSKKGYDDYRAKRKPMDDDYRAKRKPLDDDYWAKRKTLYDDYLAKIKPMEDDYLANVAVLFARCYVEDQL
jgi:hypothetical protein